MPNTQFKDYSNFKVKDTPYPLRFVQGGTMDIGEDEEKHSVTIPSFYMGQYPVTQELYEVVMETNPSYHKGATRPVENVSWNDAHRFLKKLNIITGKKFRLPSESEWEYAARGGVDSQGYEYCGSDSLEQVGWYYKNSGEKTKPVGLLLPNELGIYDMSGNVHEWCEDDYHSNFKDAPLNGKPWIDGETFTDRTVHRVIRGGIYYNFADYCRLAFRSNYMPGTRYNSVGFRLVLAPVQ